jgi:hypothetical protein
VGAHAVDEIAAAARTTLAAGSARVHGRIFHDPPRPPETDLGSRFQGVTDLARHRTRVEQRFSGHCWGALDELLVERFPWLGDVEGDADDVPESMTMVYAGTRRFFGDDRGWYSVGEGDVQARRRHEADPVWIVEVLGRVDGAEERAADDVRGEPCRRLGFGIDLRRHRERLSLPSRGALAGPRLAGDVWIDAAGRIRRVTWASATARRPRSPLNTGIGHGVWHTTELWDFGVGVDIDVPKVEPDRTPFLRTLFEISAEVWRTKRAYERRSRTNA